MRTHDLQGRPYLTEAQAKPGVTIEVDGDFTCISEGERRTLQGDEGTLFFRCNEGKHFLDGQYEDGVYIGVYLCE